MEANILVQSYDTYGAHATLSILGDLIADATRGVDCGVSILEAVACFPAKRRARRSLETAHARFHSELAALPTARWERKKRRLALRYQSQLGFADDVLKPHSPSATLFRAALEELIAVLKAAGPKLTKMRGLDYPALLIVMESLSGMAPVTDAELVAFHDAKTARRRQEASRLPWWERLGVDWDDFHPAARRLLDDEFFWDPVDAYSPHGNDTGADLLAEFRGWRRSQADADASGFLDSLLQHWGILTNWRDKPLEAWGADEALMVGIYDEAIVALAFAVLKLDGDCRADLIAAALEAVDREQAPEICAHFGWVIPPERIAALDKVKRKLLEIRGA